ncbi:MAG: extracellular solute-binding protein [Clostridia bacterium]|nr:extracellular solute-binding protein [Clostridia bacterium]
MKAIKKILSFVLCLSLCLSMLTVAGAEGGKKKVVLWTWASGQFDAVQKGYFATHPDADWEFEEVIIDADDYLTKLQQGYASGGDMPDLLMGEIGWRASSFALGIWDNLEAEPYNFDRSTVLDYVPSVTSDAEGHVVGIENSQNPAFMAYKRDLAREYLGTDDPKELEAMFQTYDDYLTVGAQVYEKSNGTVTLFPGLGDVMTMMWMQRRDQCNMNADGDIEVSGKVKPILEYLQKARDAHIAGNLTIWSTQWYANYGQQNNILFPSASWSVTFQIEPNDPEGCAAGNWGGFSPAGGGYGWGGTCYGIYKNSEVKDEAWDFIKWCLLSVEGAQYMKGASFFTTLKEAYDDPAYTEGTRESFGDQQIYHFMMEDIASEIPSATISIYDSLVVDSMNMITEMMTADESLSADAAYDYFMEDLQMKVPDVTVK